MTPKQVIGRPAPVVVVCYLRLQKRWLEASLCERFQDAGLNQEKCVENPFPSFPLAGIVRQICLIVLKNGIVPAAFLVDDLPVHPVTGAIRTGAIERPRIRT